MADPIFGPYPDDNCNRHEVYEVVRVAALESEPITLDEAKIQLRVTFTDDDTEITALIIKARKAVENYCNISIVYQRIRSVVAYGSCWPLPYGPVIGIESVQDRQTGEGSGPVVYQSAERWTSDGDEFSSSGKVRVTYTAGMPYIPEDLKQVILEVISFLYENRGADTQVGDINKVLANADNYKRVIWI